MKLNNFQTIQYEKYRGSVTRIDTRVEPPVSDHQQCEA